MAQAAFESQMMRALRDAHPVEALREVAERLLRTGISRGDLTRRLEQLRVELRDTDRSDDEDVVLDVLDFVAGWSSPHMKI